MPHFILECSPSTFDRHDPEEVIRLVHATARDSGLFNEQDIKVRMRTDAHYLVSGDKTEFLHVFAWIMQGRTEVQRKALSDSMVRALLPLYPDLPFLAMNVAEFEKGSYTNLRMIG